MKAFNAFQLVFLFATFPFIIAWLNKNPFDYSPALFWVAIVGYILEFGYITLSVYENLE